MFVRWQKLALVLFKELLGGLREVLEDHIEEEADKDREEDFGELCFDLVETQIDEVLQLAEAFIIIRGVDTCVEFAVDSCLLGVLTLAENGFVVLEESLQVSDRILAKLAGFAKAVSTLCLGSLNTKSISRTK